MNERYCKCRVLGDKFVGKSSMLTSYTANGFPAISQFKGYNAKIMIDGKFVVEISLLDGEGNLSEICCGNNSILLCFSLSDRSSFNNILKWTKEIRNHDSEVPIVLVGTKLDLRTNNDLETVKKEEGIAKAQEIGAVIYVECSAKGQVGLWEAFDAAIKTGAKINLVKKKRCAIL